jgi:hypothetical protein
MYYIKIDSAQGLSYWTIKFTSINREETTNLDLGEKIFTGILILKPGMWKMGCLPRRFSDTGGYCIRHRKAR